MIVSTGQVGLIINNFIAIDRFDINPDIKYCFISSVRSRHCRWLINEWRCNGIYCSPITAKLLSVISNRKKRYKFSNKWIRALDLNVWHEMDGFRVMLIDANHAPGAVMFIIEGKHNDDFGRILYTGFFRADAKFYQNIASLSVLQEKRFDVICVDSTYVDFTQEFPNRRSSAKVAANLLRMLRYNGVGSVAIPVPIIGHEGFLVNISRELKCKIWLHPDRFEIAHILGINDYFSDTKDDTYIWTCSQIESQQVLFTTDSHIIKTSMTSYIAPSAQLNNNRVHMIQYSDHCSSAELRSFLSLLSFSRIIGIPNKLSPLVTTELQNLSLSGLPEAEYSCKEECGILEELLFNPFKVSWRIGLAFDYAFKKICDHLSTIENLFQLSNDENVEEMLSKTSHTNNFVSKQYSEINISDIDKLVDMPNVHDSNSTTYSFRKFFANLFNGILVDDADDNKNDVEMEQDGLHEMAVLDDMEYEKDNSQIITNFSQDNYASNKTGSNVSDTKITFGILEEQYDESVLLDHLENTFYTDEIDYDSIEDVELLEFLSDMDISKFFDDFDDLFEKYRERSIEAMSVGIMNQPYHIEENISYDSFNAPILPDVVHELLDCNPSLEFHQDDFTSQRQNSVLNSSVLKDISKNKN